MKQDKTILKKPSKTVMIAKNVSFHFQNETEHSVWNAYHKQYEVPINKFIQWYEKTISINAKNVRITIGYDQYSDYAHPIHSWFELRWEEPIPNTRFKSEMKRYEKRLEKLNKTK